MDWFLIFLVVVILCVLGAEFVNGWTDASNAITTIVSTGVLSPRKAVLLASAFNFVGVMSGTEVAKTIGSGIIDPAIISLQTVLAAILSVIIWSIAATVGIRFRAGKRVIVILQEGTPTSESHALVASLAGAGIATAGFEVLLWSGWEKVLIGLFFSTFLGFFAAFILAKVIQISCAGMKPTIGRRIFNYLQIASSAFMSENHGSNDGQKFMGIIALALVLGGVSNTFSIPFWVTVVCATVMALGTYIGGMSIVRTVGVRMVSLESWQGFSAEAAAGMVIRVATEEGVPVSTTHTAVTSIGGVAAARQMSGVDWNIARKIFRAWLLTFPVCTALAFLIMLTIKHSF